MFKVNYGAVAQYIYNIFAANAGGQKVEFELAEVVYYRVPGVVSALITADDIKILTEQVHHAALSFVTPSDSYDCTI